MQGSIDSMSAGSLRRSIRCGRKMCQHTTEIELLAKTNRFAGAVAERCVSVGGLECAIVDNVGADELKLGWLNMAFSIGYGDGWPVSMSLGDSIPRPPDDSNAKAGRKGIDGLVVECCEECLKDALERPSI